MAQFVSTLVVLAALAAGCPEKRTATTPKRQQFREALRTLLTDLDEIKRRHPEVTDTDVREKMRVAIHDGFINPKAGFALGDSFAMFSDAGNQAVRISLQRFLASGPLAAAGDGLDTAEKRLGAFQDKSVPSPGGQHYDDYFGYTDTAW